MIISRYKNKAGYTFVAWPNNPYVEIFRPEDIKGVKLHEAIPFEVWYIGDQSPTESTLKQIGNSISDYSRLD